MSKTEGKDKAQFEPVGVVTLRRTPDRTMFLKEEQGNGQFKNGPSFTLCTVIPGGSMLVCFEDRSQFIVQHNDVVRAAYEAWKKGKKPQGAKETR